MASERAGELADDFAAANREAIDFARECSDEQWQTLVPGENWTVGVVLHHIAEGHANGTRWLVAMAAGEAVTDSQDSIDRTNVEHAVRAADAHREPTILLLSENGARLESLLRGLSDQQLAQTAPFGPADGRPLPVEAMAAVAARHVRDHLGHAQAAISG